LEVIFELAQKNLAVTCSVEIISLTPRFNAVTTKAPTKNRLNGFSLRAPFSHPAEAGC
jgi:hypothetical protein